MSSRCLPCVVGVFVWLRRSLVTLDFSVWSFAKTNKICRRSLVFFLKHLSSVCTQYDDFTIWSCLKLFQVLCYNMIRAAVSTLLSVTVRSCVTMMLLYNSALLCNSALLYACLRFQRSLLECRAHQVRTHSSQSFWDRVVGFLAINSQVWFLCMIIIIGYVKDTQPDIWLYDFSRCRQSFVNAT